MSQKALCRLEAPGWNPQVRQQLEQLLEGNAGRQLPVAFDFDNTIIWGEIGEATLAILARTGVLTPANLPRALCPPFRVPEKKWMRLSECAAVTEYYEALLAPTAHEERDPAPLGNAYAWAVEIMENLFPLDIVHATQSAFECSRADEPAFIEVMPGEPAFPAPTFYPGTVELIAELVRLQYDVWIISASNVWSVRWMVLKALNPLLRRRGLKQGLRADHIVGVSTLLTDGQGRLFKDSLLVNEQPDYAALEPEALCRFRLTSKLQFPVPTYSGKLAALFDTVGCAPFLAAGDSPGDHPMLAMSQNRLWMARPEKIAVQETTRALIRKTGTAGWLVQTVCSRPAPGFVPDPFQLS